MKNERQFFLCPKCGNLAGLIEDGGGELVCCGASMLRLSPNTADASQEKHVPQIAREGCRLIVTVGSAAHPMTEEHHIAWIAAAQAGVTHRVALQHTGAPTAEFCICEGPVTVYAYCNLHGLWAKEE